VHCELVSCGTVVEKHATDLKEENAMSDPRKNRLPTLFWNPAIVKLTL
jgi:hypothetical protein